MLTIPRKKKVNDYGTGIPVHEVDALVEVLCPFLLEMFEWPGMRDKYKRWLKEYNAKKENEGSRIWLSSFSLFTFGLRTPKIRTYRLL